MSLLTKLFNTFLVHVGVRNPYQGLPEIKFHIEANYFNEHGRAVVTNYKLGLKNQEVPFVYWGEAVAPKLDGFQMDRLIAEAKRQGYIFHHLTEYGTCKIVELVNLIDIVEYDRKQSMEKLLSSVEDKLPEEKKVIRPRAIGEHSSASHAMKTGT